MRRCVRGTKDLFKEQLRVHEHIISTAEYISNLYGFSQCSVPVIEYSEVFSRALGKESDLVNKEMYTFLDRSGDSVTLRPEFTAGVMRAVENSQCSLPVRLRSFGPLFRYERPQAGRQRQFHQVNFEHIGVFGPFADAELIKMSCDILDTLGILSKVHLRVNSLGCAESRLSYKRALVEYFQQNACNLSQESQDKILFNPLRILDSKNELDQVVLKSAPCIFDYYTQNANEHWQLVRKYLNDYGVAFVVDDKLVRGLDYYTHTVFEFAAQSLSSQSGVLGGGRYDGLALTMFDKNVPAVGCALGVERVALLLDLNDKNEICIVVIPISQDYLTDAMSLSQKLRFSVNMPVIIELEGTLKARMKVAHSMQAKYAILIGSAEKNVNSYTLRDLCSGEEQFLLLSELIQYLNASRDANLVMTNKY